MISLALYQPDIPQNAGTIMRLAACLGIDLHVIEPAGFDLSDRALKRAGMDYLAHVRLFRHHGFGEFQTWQARSGGRLILATTKGTTPYIGFRFMAGDMVMVGRESAGVPEDVHRAAEAEVIVPMAAGLRSLNVATAAAMIVGEALRQTGGFPSAETDAPAPR